MNTKFAAIATLGALSLAAIAPQAAAADNGFYVGAGLTRSELDVDEFGSDSLDDNSFKLIVGFRPLDWLAVEANYIDLGSADEGGASLDAKATTVSALAIAEFAVIDLYARVGMANWKLNASLDGFGSASDDGWEPTYGVGIGAHFGSLGVRAEYERFSVDDLDFDVNTVSLSVTYTFL
ncbi:MAG TPA: porin family protein [Steroidobacteraceae bacterium]|jgi:OOP family OmpA-OmpF porin|nr:porin family protein [Steroidobacteraceae bacterium]